MLTQLVAVLGKRSIFRLNIGKPHGLGRKCWSWRCPALNNDMVSRPILENEIRTNRPIARLHRWIEMLEVSPHFLNLHDMIFIVDLDIRILEPVIEPQAPNDLLVLLLQELS